MRTPSRGLQGSIDRRGVGRLPVGRIAGTETTLTVPQSGSVLAAYQSEVQKFIDTAIGPQVSKLQEQIKSSGSLSARNNLGVLYAKYGQADKAEQEFKDILSSKQDLPAMLNLGHLYFAREDWSDALALYQQASEFESGERPCAALACPREPGDEALRRSESGLRKTEVTRSHARGPVCLPGTRHGDRGTRRKCRERASGHSLGERGMRLARRLIVILFVLAAFCAGAQSYNVSFLEGEVRVRSGAALAGISIGDNFPRLRGSIE